jgi:hypothetical protein
MFNKKEYMNQYKLTHKKEKAIHDAIYYQKHKEEVRKKQNIYSKKYHKTHKLEEKKYREEHKKEISIGKRNCYLKKREYYLECMKKYQETHRRERNQHEKNRRRIDNNYRILLNIRTRINLALKRNSKITTTTKLLGCSLDFLKLHLESQFKLGMNWDNYGKWHVDHKIPCASFDLSKPSEQRKCFHYTNLQPL